MGPETWAIVLVISGTVLLGAVVFIATVLGVRYALRTGGFEIRLRVQEGQPDPLGHLGEHPAHKD